jgi:hypothetical protein
LKFDANFDSAEAIYGRFIREFGCGYPGDEKTRNWLKACYDPVFGFPTIVRFSWKTCKTYLENNGSNAEWFDPDPKEQAKAERALKKNAKLNFTAVSKPVPSFKRTQNLAVTKPIYVENSRFDSFPK